MTIKNNTYKLNITGNGIKVDREISEAVGAKIMALIMGVELTSTTMAPQEKSLSTSSIINEVGGEAPSPKVFLAQKKPSSEIERMTTLAYYLTHYREMTEFKTLNLTKLNTEAAQRNFSNAAVFVNNAEKEEYLSKASGGCKQITVLGEAIVDALPDRAKVKQIIEDHKASHSRRMRKTHKKKSKNI